jgi:hypothetical protein
MPDHPEGSRLLLLGTRCVTELAIAPMLNTEAWRRLVDGCERFGTNSIKTTRGSGAKKTTYRPVLLLEASIFRGLTACGMAYVLAATTTRNPMEEVSNESGTLLLRKAERLLLALLSQKPPRTTRSD